MSSNVFVQDLLIVTILILATPLLGLTCLYAINRYSAWGIGK